MFVKKRLSISLSALIVLSLSMQSVHAGPRDSWARYLKGHTESLMNTVARHCTANLSGLKKTAAIVGAAAALVYGTRYAVRTDFLGLGSFARGVERMFRDIKYTFTNSAKLLVNVGAAAAAVLIPWTIAEKLSITEALPDGVADIVGQQALQGAVSSAAAGTKHKADLKWEDEVKLTFRGVIGGVPQEIHDLADQLQHPEAYRLHKVKFSSGILLHGVPGAGKTHLVRAMAGELGVPFIAIKSADVVSKWMGDTEKEIKRIFDDARHKALNNEHKLAIIFMDEIDSIGAKRGSSASGDSHGAVAARASMLNTLLHEMDGFEKDDRCTILVIGATNRPEELDAALLRAGRFTEHIKIELPDAAKREAILEHYLKNSRYEHNALQVKEGSRELFADLSPQRTAARKAFMAKLAAATDGKSPADLEAVVNGAKRIAAASRALMLTEDLIWKCAKARFNIPDNFQAPVRPLNGNGAQQAQPQMNYNGNGSGGGAVVSSPAWNQGPVPAAHASAVPALQQRNNQQPWWVGGVDQSQRAAIASGN